jgi:hypothetical protein
MVIILRHDLVFHCRLLDAIYIGANILWFQRNDKVVRSCWTTERFDSLHHFSGTYGNDK